MYESCLSCGDKMTIWMCAKLEVVLGRFQCMNCKYYIEKSSGDESERELENLQYISQSGWDDDTVEK